MRHERSPTLFIGNGSKYILGVTAMAQQIASKQRCPRCGKNTKSLRNPSADYKKLGLK